MDEDDQNLLKSEFLCNQCKSNISIDPKLLPPLPSQTSSRSRHASRSVNNQTATSSTTTESSLQSQTTSNNSHQASVCFQTIDNERALKTLTRLAKIMNPKQMKLPKNIKTSFDIPGLSKVEWWTKEGNKIFEQNLKKKENKDNFVSIPRKTCFICRKYCLKDFNFSV